MLLGNVVRGTKMTQAFNNGASVTQLQPASLHDVSRDRWEPHDGPGALAIAAEFWPHLAVIDIGLPPMRG
jgi:hypothetical protein